MTSCFGLPPGDEPDFDALWLVEQERSERYDAEVDAALSADDTDAALARLARECEADENFRRRDAA